MEDAHSFVTDFGSIRGQGFFAVFDGHAGKHAAEWCGSHFHEVRRKTAASSYRVYVYRK
jgi:protein phosphatase PTC1